MKRSAIAAILFLLMLLLVATAGFVFLFQAGVRLRDEARSLAATRDTLQAQVADDALALAAAEATRDAAATALAAAEQDKVDLEGDLVESQQTIERLNNQTAQLNDQIDNLQTELTQTQSAAPVARIVTPTDGATLPVGQPVEIVLVAGDATGLTNLTLEIDGRRYSTYAIDGDTLYARTLTWSAPAEAGEHTFAVSAVNLNGIAGEPESISVQVADTEAANSAIRATVEANVSELRGLEPLTPVAPVVLTRDELRDRVTADLAEDLTPAEAMADTLELSAFDFIARDYDLYSAMVQLQSEGILGFYDPDTAEFVVVSDGALLDPAAQWTHAHEFVHALQDQHYDLDALTDDSLDSEAQAAVRALAEGEAELVQYLYLTQGDYFTQSEVDAILSDPGQTDDGFLQGLPPVLVNNMAFPYTSGVEFVVDLYREGGFAAIDAAWRNPPRSSEHILHPDRYRAGDAPQLVALAPLTATLGVGWAQVEEDVLGEFFLREYLDQQLPSTLAAGVAEGWGGDRYAVYANEATGELVMALRLVWDTDADAAEFAAAYPAYPEGLFGPERRTQPDGSTCWSGEDVICFLQAEGESWVVRAPDVQTAASVLGVLRP